jgi:hypothetical protein
MPSTQDSYQICGESLWIVNPHAQREKLDRAVEEMESFALISVYGDASGWLATHARKRQRGRKA